MGFSIPFMRLMGTLEWKVTIMPGSPMVFFLQTRAAWKDAQAPAPRSGLNTTPRRSKQA